MSENEPQQKPEAHTYQIEAMPRRNIILLVFLGLFVVAVLAAILLGLYRLNADQAPTPTSNPEQATQAAIDLTQTAPDETPTPPVTPGEAALPSETPTISASAQTEWPTYTVKSGDTLIGIATLFNVGLDDLIALNQLEDETIRPDQVLSVPATATPWPEQGPFHHTIAPGETLITIAALYEVTVDEIKILNGLTSDNILADQEILIPGHGARPPTATPAPPPTATPKPWSPGFVEAQDDLTLADAYPLEMRSGRFGLHYKADSSAAADPLAVIQDVQAELAAVELALQVEMTGHFELYLADELFAEPYLARRAVAQPAERRLFWLNDGAGTQSERAYQLRRELSRLVAWNSLGQAASELLEQGLAVHVAWQALDDRYLSLEHVCAAYHQARQLPDLWALSFQGLLDRPQHYPIAGCFARFLIQEQGLEAWKQVYTSGDYDGVYGLSLGRLQTAWQQSLAEYELAFEPDDWTQTLADVSAGYEQLFGDFAGQADQFAVYYPLDKARVALYQGRLDAARVHLEELDAFLDTD